jgi:ferrous iron transport protein A
MTLDKAKTGKVFVVRGIEAGSGLRQRLAGLGIRPGDELRIMREALFSGPVLVRINDVQLAIGGGMASRIEVDEVTAP